MWPPSTMATVIAGRACISATSCLLVSSRPALNSSRDLSVASARSAKCREIWSLVIDLATVITHCWTQTVKNIDCGTQMSTYHFVDRRRPLTCSEMSRMSFSYRAIWSFFHTCRQPCLKLSHVCRNPFPFPFTLRSSRSCSSSAATFRHLAASSTKTF
jgi:hypothetical protein